MAGQTAGGAAGGRSGNGPLSRSEQQALLSQALRGDPSDLRNLNELFRQSSRGGAAALDALLGGALGGRRDGAGEGGGAAAAAGVLTAIDEDNEGDEEADVPREFEYFTDGEEEDEEL